jgi:hypothetical protein
MTARFSSLRIADRRDVFLFVLLGVLAIAVTIAWALLITPIYSSATSGKAITLGTLLILSILAGLIPYFTWGRGSRRPIAALMVRIGLALQIFGLIVTPIGLVYETNPVISVPVGFASFLTVFFGVFIAGFGGNMLAPPRA